MYLVSYCCLSNIFNDLNRISYKITLHCSFDIPYRTMLKLNENVELYPFDQNSFIECSGIVFYFTVRQNFLKRTFKLRKKRNDINLMQATFWYPSCVVSQQKSLFDGLLFVNKKLLNWNRLSMRSNFLKVWFSIYVQITHLPVCHGTRARFVWDHFLCWAAICWYFT